MGERIILLECLSAEMGLARVVFVSGDPNDVGGAFNEKPHIIPTVFHQGNAPSTHPIKGQWALIKPVFFFPQAPTNLGLSKLSW